MITRGAHADADGRGRAADRDDEVCYSGVHIKSCTVGTSSILVNF